MPVLKNQRHEQFAQQIAEGRSTVEAYELAGYKPNRSHASRLAAEDHIRARVRELGEAAAAKTEVTAAGLLEELDEIRREAKAAKQYGAAVSAVGWRAKISGNVVDRREEKQVNEFSKMSKAELDAFIAEEMARMLIELGASATFIAELEMLLTRFVGGETAGGYNGAGTQQLEGQPNWRVRKPDGRLPAPPHDETGHT